MIGDIVVQVLRGYAAKAVQEGFEPLMIRVHVLDMINLFGHVAFLARIDLLVRQLRYETVV